MADDFVRARGHQLMLRGRPFYFAGTNSHHLLTHAADPGCRPGVLRVLDDAAALSLTVLRAWAFSDGDGWNALQPRCGEFDKQVLEGLDWLLVECSRRGLRLLLSLTNFWGDYGGMPQYVRWCEPVCEPSSAPAERFYSSASCQAAFQRFLSALVLRVNTISGLRYTDEPSIFGWELANEPRCRGDASGTVIRDWVSATAAFLCTLDRNHLIGVGSEGFFGAATPGLLPLNPYPGAELEGVDFLSQHQDPNIDFASFHAYPDHWHQGCRNAIAPRSATSLAGSSADALAASSGATSGLQEHQAQQAQQLLISRTGSPACTFLDRWVAAHVDICLTALRKPLILSEFGVYRCSCGMAAGVRADTGSCSIDDAVDREAGRATAAAVAAAPTSQSTCRDACFAQVYDRLVAQAAANGPLTGAMFWMLAAPDFPDHDGFTLHRGNCNDQGALNCAAAAAGRLRSLSG